MNAKEYLSQAFRLDQRINSKLGQVASLRELATKITANIHTEKVSGTKQRSPMENALVKLIALEYEINSDIERLVGLKQEIMNAVTAVKSDEHRLLLELRYLSFKTWEEIAEIMNYSYRQVHRMHGEALKGVCID